jgi:hypothetical protein
MQKLQNLQHANFGGQKYSMQICYKTRLFSIEAHAKTITQHTPRTIEN